MVDDLKKTELLKEKETAKKHPDPFDIYNKISILVVIIAVSTIALLFFQECSKCFSIISNLPDAPKHTVTTKKFWIYGKNIESGYLNNVLEVFGRFGYIHDPNATDWDVLWAHDYPFRTLQSKLKQLHPHQRVNKFPGSGYITNKVDLATSGLKYIPSAFRLPKDKENLLKYVEANANTQFVQKSNDHRNIRIKQISEIDLNSDGTFIQEFVDKPLLVSGYKFDIGVYTIITSVDPLRIYIYNGDALLRFCPVKYEPFDPNNLDKYVVGDDYLPTWEVPALKYYYNTLGFGMKDSLNAYVRSEGKDPSKIWEQIEDSIRIVGLAKEPQINEILNRFGSKGNFFELMRFDFVVTEDLTVYLMEANMSPNLSSAHFPPNKLLFEQVIFNLFGLVGVTDRTKPRRSANEELMIVAGKNLMVFPTECNSYLCRSGCLSPICQLCKTCLNVQTKQGLIEAYREHINKGACKRIFPPSLNRTAIDIYEDLEEYSAENQLQYRWFQGKCLLDPSWCI